MKPNNELERIKYIRHKLTRNEVSLTPALDLINKLNGKSISVLPKNHYTLTYYTTPTKTDMAVILTYCNPANSVRILQNFLQVQHFLQKAHIPVYVGEVAFGTDAFLLKEAAVQLRTSSYMFYKENLNKLVEQQIPAIYTKLCMMDANILFEQTDWYDTVQQKLDEVQVCQPFTSKTWLDIHFVKESSSDDHVWAFQRAWYTTANLTDRTVVGASDFLFAEPTESTTRVHSFYKEALSLTLPTKTYGVCPLSIVHLFHGDPKNRTSDTAVITLQVALRRACKTLDEVLERRADGLLEWVPDVRQVFNTAFHKYFVNCNNDEVGTILFDKFTPTQYASSESDMAIIIPFSNTKQSIRSVQNILTVKHFMESAGLPVFIAETASPFLFNKEPNIFQDSSKDDLISTVEACIPPEYTKLCIMEPDILFGESTWYPTVSKTLDRVDITQPFNRALLLALNYTSEYEKTNCIDKPRCIPVDSFHETTGMVWAFNRTWFQQQPAGSGLLDACMKGKSESCALSIYKLPTEAHTKEVPMQKTVVHVWVSDCIKANNSDPEWIKNAGLGDLVRGSIGLYKLCKMHNYNFIVDISLHPLSKFLNHKKHKYSDIVEEQKHAIVGIHHGDMNTYIPAQLTKKNYLLCHCISWLTTFDLPADEDLKLFIKNILKPNKEFQEVLYSTISSLPFSKYNIVHFRLGDDELVHNKFAIEYNKYLSLFESLKCDIPNTLLLSDSNTLKKTLTEKYNVFSLSHAIAHVGMHTDISAIQNTLVEFFLLINAISIVSFTKYRWISGFAKIASYIYDVPLTYKINV
jgi:hypothetical protein